MAGVIDLRQDAGLDIANARALGNIFAAVGRQEQLRKKKYDLDTMMGQIAAGEPVENAVQIARDNPAPYSKGLGGIMQRVGNFASLGQREDISDSVTEMLLMNKLKESMKYQGLTPEEITQSKRVEAGVEARPGVQRQNFKPVYKDGAITGYVDLTSGQEASLPEGTVGNAPKTAFKPVYRDGTVTGYIDLTTGQEAPLPAGTSGSAPKTNFKPIYRDGSITGYMDLTSGQEAPLPEGTAGNAPQKPILKQGGDGKWYRITPVDGPDIPGEGSAGVGGGGLSATPIEGIPAKAPKVDNNAILKISEAIGSMSVTPQNYEAYNEIAKKNGYEIKKTTRPGRVIPAKKGFFGNEVEPERRAADIEEYQLVPLQQGAASEGSTSEGFGKRPDGTEKGTGWLGVLPLTIEKDGETFDGEATEYSVDTDAVKVNGKRVLFPTLVPTLTPEEVKVMQNDIIPNKKEVPAQILKKAEAFAKQRIAEGKSPFIQQGEQPTTQGQVDKNGAIEISNPDLLDDMRTGLKLIENRQKSPEVIYNAFIKTYTDPNDVAVINSIFNK